MHSAKTNRWDLALARAVEMNIRWLLNVNERMGFYVLLYNFSIKWWLRSPYIVCDVTPLLLDGFTSLLCLVLPHWNNLPEANKPHHLLCTSPNWWMPREELAACLTLTWSWNCRSRSVLYQLCYAGWFLNVYENKSSCVAFYMTTGVLTLTLYGLAY